MHTPVPWKCEQMGSEGWMVFANHLSMPHPRVLASNLSEDDARLITAAPKLLRALQRIVHDADRATYLGEALNAARAAIQEAESHD